MTYSKNILAFVLLVASLGGYAQTQIKDDDAVPSKLKSIVSAGSKKRWHWFTDAVTVDPANPVKFFEQYQEAFELQTGVEMILVSQAEEKELGMHHYRFQQTYKGIPIVGAEYILHQRAKHPLKGNGNLIRGFAKDDKPAITGDIALQSALKTLDAKKYAWEDASLEKMLKEQKGKEATFMPQPVLVYYADPSTDGEDPSSYQLVYAMTVFATEPMSNQQFYVSAQTGEVVRSYNLLHETNTPATGTTSYNGTQSFTSFFTGSNYVLRETDRQGSGTAIATYDMNNSTNFSTAVDFQNIGTDWQNNEPVGVQGHWSLEKTFDYYWMVHGRNSYDNSGGAITAYLNYGVNYNNASWSPITHTMLFGGGDNVTKTSWASLDVVAHELTHGVTELSAGLVYLNESGALNESFSDIFGALVEYHVEGSAGDWLVSEDVTIDGSGIRSMSNPNAFNDPDTYHGTYWIYSDIDNGGVHTNSGVQNHWFYLLSDGGSGTNDHGNSFSLAGIGKETAAAIAYRNLTQYLTADSRYADAREGALSAAEDLFGRTSDEYAQTAMAWYAVGVGYPAYTGEDLAIRSISIAGSSCNEVRLELINQSTLATIPAGAIIDVALFENGIASPVEQVVLTTSLAPSAAIMVTLTQELISANAQVYVSAVISYPPDPETGNNEATTSLFREVMTIGGTNPDFPTIDAALTAIANPDIKICGHLVFKIRSGQYYGEVRINNIVATTPENTITFESESGNPADVILYSSIPFNSAYGGITIANSKHVRFKNITVIRESVSPAFVSVGLALRGSVDDILIEGCVFRNPGTGDLRSSLEFWPFGERQNNIRIRRNTFEQANDGIALGNMQSSLIDNISIEDNQFTNLQYTIKSMVIGGKLSVLRNRITSQDAKTVFYGGGSDVLVEGNDIRVNGTSSLTGFYIDASASAAVRVVNNMMSLKSTSVSTGITISTALRAEVLHNTIRQEKTTSGNGSATSISLSSNLTQKIVANNIIYNTVPSGALGMIITGGTGNDINNNDFYIPSGATGRFNSTSYQTLAQWRAATGYDMNSITEQPSFVSDIDLHLAGQQLILKNGKSVNVQYDMDGDQRGLPRYIGADEYFFSSDLGVSAIQLAAPVVLCERAHIQIEVRNFSAIDIFASGIRIPVEVMVSNNVPVRDTVILMQNLLPGQIVTHTFDSLFNLQENTSITARTTFPGDQNPANDVHITTANFHNVVTVGGVNPDFTTIQAAINFIGGGGLNGALCNNIYVRIRPGTYVEPLSIADIPGLTLIIESESGNKEDVTIAYGPASTISLLGAKRVTFRNLTLQYLGSYTTEATVLLKNTCTDIAFTNCLLQVPSLVTEHYAIKAGPSQAPQVNGLRVSHCEFVNGGIKMESNANVSYPFDNIRIDSSQFTQSNTHAISITRTGAVTISDNVLFSTNTSSGISITQPLKDVRVERNRITLNAGVHGIYFYNLIPSFSKIFVFNNFVNLKSGASTVTGMTIEGKGGYVYHNTIKISQGPVQASSVTVLTTRNSGVATRNNILYSAIANAVGIDWYNSSTNEDYNDIYVPQGFIGKWNTQYFNTLASWQAALNMDLQSVTNPPYFVNENDLHIAQDQPVLRGGNAFLFPFVYGDIDGDQRSLPLYMGADEYIHPPFVDVFPDSIFNVPSFGKTYTIGVNSNSDWEIIPPLPNGVTIDAVEQDEFTLTVSANPQSGPRSFTVTARTLNTPVGVQSLYLSQEGPPVLSATAAVNSVDLSWQPVTEAANYNLLFSTDGLPADSLLVTLPGATTNYTHSGLPSGTSYTYLLVAMDASGTRSIASSPVTVLLPNASVEVSPGAIPSASLFGGSYNISVTGNSTWEIVSIPEGIAISNVTASGFRVSLSANPFNTPREFLLTVRTMSSPAAVANLSIVQVGTPVMTAEAGDAAITLSWIKPAGTKVYQYRIYRDDAIISARAGVAPSPLTLIATLPADQTTYTNTGLTNGVTYHYHLSVVDYYGNESPLSQRTSATAGYPTSLSDENAELSLYPNPADNQLSISGRVKATGVYEVVIINSYGMPVGRQKISVQSGTLAVGINVSELKASIYLLRIIDPTGNVMAVYRFEKR